MLCVTESHAGLRTILSAGTAAGAMWVVDDDGGADFRERAGGMKHYLKYSVVENIRRSHGSEEEAG